MAFTESSYHRNTRFFPFHAGEKESLLKGAFANGIVLQIYKACRERP